MAKNDEVPVEDIPEVAAFVEVQQRYETFKASNQQFFDYLDSLTEEYNNKLDAANKAVRSRGVSCGPFDKFQTQTRYDAEAMYTVLGPEKFLAMGGKEEITKKRTLDKKRVEMNIQAGNIDKDAAGAIKQVSPRYRSIEGIKLP
jgi:hypothetical protein